MDSKQLTLFTSEPVVTSKGIVIGGAYEEPRQFTYDDLWTQRLLLSPLPDVKESSLSRLRRKILHLLIK
jgi:hypothetical protein